MDRFQARHWVLPTYLRYFRFYNNVLLFDIIIRTAKYCSKFIASLASYSVALAEIGEVFGRRAIRPHKYLINPHKQCSRFVQRCYIFFAFRIFEDRLLFFFLWKEIVKKCTISVRLYNMYLNLVLFCIVNIIQLTCYIWKLYYYRLFFLVVRLFN